MGDPIRGRSLPELRRRAVEMAASGTKATEICRSLGVARSTAWRWIKQYAEHGDVVIDKRIGRPPRLTPEQVEMVVGKLTLGALACGYDSPLWTLRRIADTIRDATGVSFNTNYLSEYLHSLGWSCQKPERRARERDEDSIKEWVRVQWPDIKKKPRS